MTDYAALSDSELNRRIAERLGYRVERREGFISVMMINSPKPGFVLVRPDGGALILLQGKLFGYETEDEAWDAAPRWSNDVGAAMSLLKDLPYQIHHDPAEFPAYRHLVRITPAGTMAAQAQNYSESLPRAIAECWLMLTERVE